MTTVRDWMDEFLKSSQGGSLRSRRVKGGGNFGSSRGGRGTSRGVYLLGTSKDDLDLIL